MAGDGFRTTDAYVGHADLYDDLYAGRSKDYAAESAAIAALVRSIRSNASSLLDVGCGTGSHLVAWRDRFADVVGVEPSAPMRAIAEARLPGVPLIDQDARTLRLGRRFDAVVCMFATIGYIGGRSGDIDALNSAIAAMARHVEPGGVLVVEPWMTPARYSVGHIGTDFTNKDGRTIFRMSHSGFDPAYPRVSVVAMHYLVGTPDGIDHTTDVHYMSMYSEQEFRHAFAAAGCSVRLVDPGFGHGVYVGVRARLHGGAGVAE
jgi:SAM-dependent methyltransferase